MKSKDELNGDSTKVLISEEDIYKKLEILALNTEEPCVLVNPSLEIITFNTHFSQLYQQYYGKEIARGECIIDYSQQKTADALTNIYSQVFKGLTHRSELEIETSNNVQYTFILNYRPAYDEHGNIIAAFVTAGNITEKKQAERRLSVSEKRFKSIIEHSGDIIALTEASGKTIYISPSFSKLTGIDEESLKNKLIFEIIHADFTEESQKMLNTVLANPGKAVPYSTRFYNAHVGDYTYIEGFVTNLLHDKHVEAIVANFRDVTERVKADEKLKLAERRFETLIDHNYDGIVLRDKDFKIIYGNSSSEKIMGWTFEDKLGKDFTDKTHPEDMEKVKENQENVLRNPGVSFPCIFRTRHKKGHYVWVERVMTNMLHDKAINAIVANFRDISEQKSVQERLVLSEKRYRALVENTGDSIAIIGLDGKPNYVSPSIKKVLGYSEEEALALNMMDIVHPEEREGVAKVMSASLENPGVTMKGHTARLLHKDGSWRWCEALVINMLQDPLIQGFVNNFRDITEKILSEQAREFDQNNLNALINNTHDLMWSISTEGKLITSNRAFDEMVKRMSGHDVEKGGDAPMKGFPEQSLQRWKGYYQRAFTGEIFTVVEHALLPTENWSEISFYPIYRADKIVGTACFSHDITERKLFERKLENNTLQLLLAKKELEHSESRLKQAQSMTHIGNWEIDLLGDSSEWSDECCRIYGLHPGDNVILIEEWKTFIHPEDLAGFENVVNAGRKDKSDYTFQHRIVRKNGEIRHVISESRFELDAKKNPVALYGVVLDITEQVLAQKEIHQSHQLLQKLTQKVPVVVYQFKIDRHGVSSFPFIAKTIQDILPDIDIEEIKQNAAPLFEKIHPDDISQVQASIQHSHKHLEYWDQEFRLTDKHSDTIWMRGSSIPERMDNGDTLWFGYLQNITEKKFQDEKIRLSKERYDVVAKATNDAIWDWDIHSDELYWNEGHKTLFGYEEGSSVQSIESLTSRAHPEDKKKIMDSLSAIFTSRDANVWHEEFRYLKKDGNYATVLNRAFLMRTEEGQVYRMIGALQDITEAKAAEEKIRLAKERYDIVAKATNEAIWDWDIQNDELHWGEGYRTLFGYKINTGKTRINSWLELIHPEERKAVSESIMSLVNKSTELKWEMEYRYMKADGNIANVMDRGYVIRDEDGNAKRMIGAMQDISRQKMVSEKIRLAKERYDFVAKATNDAIYDWNLVTNKTVRSGDGLKTLFGYDPEQASAEKNFWTSRFHPEDYKIAYAALKKALLDPTVNYCNQEYRFMKADGNYAYVFDKGFIIRDKNGKALRMIGATQDITKTKEAELQLKELNEQLEKRAQELIVSNTELEQFAYIASHDLQEPLRMVTSFLTLLENKYKDQLDEKAKQYIYFATDGATRMRKLILDLLEYSRVGRQIQEKTEVDCNDLLYEAVKLNRAVIDEKKALIDWNKLPTVTANRTGLLQVFQNLIGNALKYQRTGESPQIKITASETDTHWQFAVSDNGIGIEERYFEKIFIVFQRLHNKDEFSGTGIGLSICKKIIENHQGRLWVESQYGKGSTFLFTLIKSNPVDSLS